MNLEKLFDKQRELDERIVREKGLEGVDLLPKKILALQVELGELANEARFFKFWSEDQKPKQRKTIVCPTCKGMGKHYQPMTWDCRHCHGTGIKEKVNPLLEEYVDGVHFFISIALDKGWEEHLYVYEDGISDVREEGFDGGVESAFIEINYWLSKIRVEKEDQGYVKSLGYSKHEFAFKNAWFIFLAIGDVEFGFTFEQVYEAYMDKNKVNHARQSEGY